MVEEPLFGKRTAFLIFYFPFRRCLPPSIGPSLVIFRPMEYLVAKKEFCKWEGEREGSENGSEPKPLLDSPIISFLSILDGQNFRYCRSSFVSVPFGEALAQIDRMSGSFLSFRPRLHNNLRSTKVSGKGLRSE